MTPAMESACSECGDMMVAGTLVEALPGWWLCEACLMELARADDEEADA